MKNPTLEAYAELQSAFEHYNQRLFDGQLPACLITMQREKRTYGYFSSQRFVHRGNKTTTDEIAINPSYFGVVPLLEILQTIVHEMAHGWQFHFGTPGRRGYHNKEWADKMESIGLMPSSTGQPGGAKTGEKMADYAIAGGRFMLATNELLETGFQVSWLDRFPPVTPVRTHSVQGYTTTQATTDEAEPADLIEAQNNELSSLAELLSAPAQGNRSNRIKYRCPSCQSQVWGKPNLRLNCGEDDCNGSRFEPVE